MKFGIPEDSVSDMENINPDLPLAELHSLFLLYYEYILLNSSAFQTCPIFPPLTNSCRRTHAPLYTSTRFSSSCVCCIFVQNSLRPPETYKVRRTSGLPRELRELNVLMWSERFNHEEIDIGKVDIDECLRPIFLKSTGFLLCAKRDEAKVV